MHFDVSQIIVKNALYKESRVHQILKYYCIRLFL